MVNASFADIGMGKDFRMSGNTKVHHQCWPGHIPHFGMSRTGTKKLYGGLMKGTGAIRGVEEDISVNGITHFLSSSRTE